MASVADCFRQHEGLLAAAGVDVRALRDRAFEIRQLDGVHPMQAARDAVEEYLNTLDDEMAALEAEAAGQTFEQAPVSQSMFNAQTPDGDHPFRVSTRQPVSPKATEDSVRERLVIGVEQYAQLNDKQKSTVVEHLKSIPGFRTNKRTFEAVIEDFVEHVRENLLWLYDQIPEAEHVLTRKWYDGARRIATEWATRYGVPDYTIAGVLAALSPQKDWFQNVSLAERVLDIHLWANDPRNGNGQFSTPEMREWAKAKYAEDPKGWEYAQQVLDVPYHEITAYGNQTKEQMQARWLRFYDEAHNPRAYRLVSPEGDFIGEPSGKVGWGSFAEIGKAVYMVEHQTYESTSAGLGQQHKVRNFFNNILAPNAPHGDVTIDTHAVAAGLILPLGGNAKEVLSNFGSGSPTDRGTAIAIANNLTGIKGLYGIYAEAYRRAAADRDILAREMQSITWEAVRTLFLPKFKTAANLASIDALWNTVPKRNATKEDRDGVRAQIAEFAGGFATPESITAGSELGDQPAGGGGTSYVGSVRGFVLPEGRGPEGDRLGGLGRRAGPAPGAATTFRQGAVGPAVERAARDGGRAEAGVDVAGTGGRLTHPLTFLQRVFHGTPHTFKVLRLDPEAIGSGEGGAAYGWGYYFATNKNVARTYVPRSEEYESALLERLSEAEDAGNGFAALVYESALLHLQPDELRDRHQGPEYADAINDVEGLMAETPGVLYEADLDNATFDKLLNWNVWIRDQGLTKEQLQALVDAKALFTDYGAQDAEDVFVAADGQPYALTTPGSAVYISLWRSQGGMQQASAFLNKIGIPGHRYLDAESVVPGAEDLRGLPSEPRDGTYNLVVYPGNEDAVTFTAANGTPLGQALGQGDAATPRGSITIPAGGLANGPAIIRLFDGHDLSTLLHESAHLFITVYKHLVDTGAATPELAADYQLLVDKFGDMTTTEGQEGLAVAFEAWLIEGKAPSVELEGAFRRFRSWLTRVYKLVRDRYFKDVKLDDEVREVFARMLATDEQVQAVEQYMGFEPLIPDEQIEQLMPAGEARAYRVGIRRVAQEYHRKLELSLMEDVRRARSAEYKARQKVLTEENTARINAIPEYQAWEFLRNGTMLRGDLGQLPKVKLDKAMLVHQFGADFLQQYPNFRGLYRVKGGLHPNAVAEWFGVESGVKLMNFIAAQPTRADMVSAMTQAHLKNEFGDKLGDGSIRQEALDLAHSNARATLLRREMEALEQIAQAPRGRLRARIGKALAARVLGQKKIKDATKAGLYAAGESRAAKAAERALLKGKPEEAAVQARKRYMQHLLYTESARLRDEVEKARAYARKFDRAGLERTIAPGHIEQIRALLDRVELRRDTRALREGRAEARKALADFVREQENEGEVLPIPARVQRLAETVHYTEMTAEDFQAVIDSVRMLEHAGRELISRDAAHKQAVAEIVGSIDANAKRKKLPGRWRGNTWADPAKNFVREADAIHLKPENVFRWLDGDQSNGAVWTNMFRKIADAEGVERDMMLEAGKRFQELYGRLSEFERDSLFDISFNPDGMGPITRSSMLSIAFNWGNEENRTAIVEGYGRIEGWTRAQIENALGELSTTEWDFVEGVWEFIDSFWPQIEALQKKMTGVAPPKVEASPFEVNGRRLRGGYYPLVPDPEVSDRAFVINEAARIQSEFGGNYLQTTTRHGHTEARVGFGGMPPKLDLSVFTTHVNNVIHDLAFREAVRDVNRLINDPAVRSAISESVSPQFYRHLRPWLSKIANEAQLDPSNRWEKAFGFARTGVTIMYMGLKFTTALMQPIGYTQSIPLVGEKYAFSALGWFLNPAKLRENIAWALEKSPTLRHRQATFDRDVRDQLRKLKKRGWHVFSVENYFKFIGWMDMAVSIPTWKAAYDKTLDENGGNEADAIAAADSVVRLTQGSGSPKDLAPVQRGGEATRLFTMFYTYGNALYNMLRRSGRLAANDRTPSGMMRFMLSMAYLVAIPAVMSELIVGRGPDDEDEYAKWVATKIAIYPFQSVIGFRDFVRGIESKWGYDITPVQGAVEQNVRTARNFGQLVQTGEWDRAATRDLVGTIGFWGHLPSSQAWLTGEYLYDWTHGDINSFSLWELFVTGKRGDKDDR